MDESPDRLRALVAGKHVKPVRRQGLGTNIGYEGVLATFNPIDRDEASSWTAWIEYEDDDGENTQRVITVKKLSGVGHTDHLYSWCHEREAFRTFRIDRVRQLICAETGEIFDPARHFRFLKNAGALPTVDSGLTHMLRMLIFLMGCDNHYHAAERDVLLDAIDRYALRFELTDKMVETAKMESIRLSPDGEDVIRALSAFRRSPVGPRLARFALDHAGLMIDADGRHADEEIYWAVEISSALKSIASR